MTAAIAKIKMTVSAEERRQRIERCQNSGIQRTGARKTESKSEHIIFS